MDPNFLPSYQAAKGAGLAVDSYMFPCTGTQPAGDPPCKPIQTQLDEFLGVIADNDMILDTLWFDLEPTSGACNAWNLSPQQNTDLARQWVAALQGTKLKWGIYANGYVYFLCCRRPIEDLDCADADGWCRNQWTSMFPSRDTDVGSSLPLWAVQFDKKPGVGTVDTFMGGWTTAVGKQYDLGQYLWPYLLRARLTPLQIPHCVVALLI